MVDLVRDRLDSTKANEGIWEEITDFGKVKLRRWNNSDYRNAALALRDVKLEELKKAPNEQLSEDESFEIMVRAACQFVIVDWEGIESNGEPIPYDPKLAIDAFLDPDDSFRDEFNLIVAAAANRQNYTRERKEATAKKS